MSKPAIGISTKTTSIIYYTMDDPTQRYRTKSRDRQRHRRKSLRSIERLQHEVYKTKQTISSATGCHQGEMNLNLSQHSKRRKSRRRDNDIKCQPNSKSTGYGACQFDANGYCIMHPDVRLAKMKAGKWKVVRENCHKCFRRTHSSSTVLTGDSFHGEHNRHHEARSDRDVHRRSSSRGRRRERCSRDEHKSTQQQSRSKSIRSRSKSFRRKIQQLTPTRRTICVGGAPFDKNGRCFVHNHIKLASRKLLGGWKIHYQFCPECARDDDYVDVDSYSVVSDISGLSVGSFISGCDDRSMASSAYNWRADASVRSSRSQRSWSSKQSKKRIDDSFLPLDEDGYCLHHPDVQLAEKCRKSGWNVLLDFCPGKKRDYLVSVFHTSNH